MTTHPNERTTPVTTLTQAELDHCARSGFDPAKYEAIKATPTRYGSRSIPDLIAALKAPEPPPPPTLGEIRSALAEALERGVSAPPAEPAPGATESAPEDDSAFAVLDRLEARLPTMTPEEVASLNRDLAAIWTPKEPA